MADAALYWQIVDVLLAEHKMSTPPQPRDAGTARKLTVTWGLCCQVHRLARSATMLADQDINPGGPRAHPDHAGAQHHAALDH